MNIILFQDLNQSLRKCILNLLVNVAIHIIFKNSKVYQFSNPI